MRGGTLRRVAVVLAIVLGVALATSWYGRHQRCQHELATVRAVEVAAVEQGLSQGDSDIVPFARSRAFRYCDVPLWEW
jgi:hypothetical protein